MEIEIQTDAYISEPEASTSTGLEIPTPGEESLASSSSTILPPTPKPRPLSLSLEDEPPTYNQVAAQRLEEEKERRRVNEVLSRWHLGAKLKGLLGSHLHDEHAQRRNEKRSVEGDESDNVDVVDVDVDGIEGGVAEDLVEEWKAMKAELGVECGVIDKILENSTKIPRNPPTSPDTPSSSSTVDKGKRRSGRFFNIYNTYVYGSSDSTTQPNTTNTSTPSKGLGTSLTNLATQTLVFASASAVVFIALTPYIPYFLSAALSSSSNIPGGANLYDRAAWASFNTLGGGAGEGIAFAARGGGVGANGLFGWGHAAGGVGAANAGGVGLGDVGTTEAVWKVLERVGGGAARMARGWPT